MRHMTTIVILAFGQFCCAETISDPRPTRLLYEASNAAMRGDPAALETMEAVADGKPTEAILAAATRAGLRAQFADVPSFRETDYSVRVFAMEMIGRTGLPEALDYLSATTPQSVGEDDSRSVYPASKVALHKALLRRETDPNQQIAFLELQLTSARVGQVALWAQEELCNRGSMRSMELIETFIMRLEPSPRGDANVAFCRRRMEIINSNPDPATAIGSVLRADAKASDERIMRWAIEQLFAFRSPDAEAVLDRYVAEVAQRFPPAASTVLTPESYMHRGFAEEIRRAAPERSQK